MGSAPPIDNEFLPSPDGFYGQNSHFGRAVDINGNHAVMGSPHSNVHGVAYVYEFDGATWQLTYTIKPTDLLRSRGFGWSVSLEADKMLIGAVDFQSYANNPGVVYVYEWNGQDWLQTNEISPAPSEHNGYFGATLSFDNDRVLIGSMEYENDSLENSGAVYVYDWNGSDWIETQIITRTNAVEDDYFGRSVSLDGDRAAIGGSDASYVFEFNGSKWLQVKKLTASDQDPNSYFGRSVRLLNDRIVIGAPYDFHPENDDAGAIYVFDWNGAQWLETQKIISNNPALIHRFGSSLNLVQDKIITSAIRYEQENQYFVYEFTWDGSLWVETQEPITSVKNISSVAISGNLILLGNDADSSYGNFSGSVYAYEWNGLMWDEKPIAAPPAGAINAKFGQSVSMFDDYAVIGAPSFWQPSSVYIYEWDGINWNESQMLSPNVMYQLSAFGSAVKLYGDRIVIGAPQGGFNDINPNGSVYIYDWNGINWVETQHITAITSNGDTLFPKFGSAISVDNDRLLVGDPEATINGVDSGAVYVFDWNGTSWFESQQIIPGDPEYFDLFGYSVSLSGNRMLIGSHKDDDDGTRSGSVYAFEFDGSVWIETQKITASDATYGEYFGYAVDLEGDRAVITALLGDNRDVAGAGNIGTVYVFEFNGTEWIEKQIIYASDAQEWDHFGSSVSLYGDSFLVGADQSYLNTLYTGGKAYLFELNGDTWVEKRQLKEPGIKFTKDGFGAAVSLFGPTALVGAPTNNRHGANSGSAYVFGGDLIYRHDFNQ